MPELNNSSLRAYYESYFKRKNQTKTLLRNNALYTTVSRVSNQYYLPTLGPEAIEKVTLEKLFIN